MTEAEPIAITLMSNILMSRNEKPQQFHSAEKNMVEFFISVIDCGNLGRSQLVRPALLLQIQV